jgi:hypothetical protein
MDQTIERIESLKAGWVGAMTTAAAFFAASGASVAVHLDVSSIDTHLIQPQFLISIAIAVLSGGLFGITYRYIVRTDSNLQLQMGAIGAFGLVRGLAQIETTWATEPFWLTALKLLASLLMFAVATLALNWTMQRGWIKQFKAF